MAKKPERLSTTLGALLTARGLRARLSEYRVLGQWERSVGSVVAGHARPVSIRGNKLFLVVDNPAWMQQLSLLKPEIMKKVNASLGRDAIRDIVLNLGELPDVASSGARRSDPLPQLTAQDREQIEGYLHDVRDPELRDAIRRVIEKDVQRKKAPSR